jgi:hypothetical protein
MSSDIEGLRTEIRRAREEADQNAQWMGVLLVIVACGGFGAVGAALSGLLIPAIMIGAVALAGGLLWCLYRIIRIFFQGLAKVPATWKHQTAADVRGRLLAIGLGLIIVSAPFIRYLLRP